VKIERYFVNFKTAILKSKFLSVLVFLFLFAPGQLRAQGLFDGLSFPTTVTATGQTEVAGAIVVFLRAGTTTAANLLIDLSPLTITNTNPADIRVTANGITVGATTVDAPNGLVRIPVNAGATSGTIRVDGIRVAVAGTGISSANAQVSFENSVNLMRSGTNLPVINAVQSGLAADPITDRFVIFNGQVFKNTSTISVREGYAGAFSNSTDFGQTVSTRLRIRVTDFPDGLEMDFPATVSSKNSAATLTTLTGGNIALSKNGSTTVTYTFNGAAGSDGVVKSFDIPFSVRLIAPVGVSQPTIDVSLAPVGAAVHNDTFPSTDVPRYAEEDIVVQPGTSVIITKTLYWTGVNASLQNRVSIFNPSSSGSNLTIDGLNASGQVVSGAGVTNPVKVSLSANGLFEQNVTDLFGTASGVSTVRIQSTNPAVVAAVTVTGSGTADATPFISQAIPSVFVRTVTEGAVLYVFNPNSSPTTGTLTLRTEDGQVAGSTPVQLAPLASTSIVLSSTFNNPASGYAFAMFSAPVVSYEAFGTGNVMNNIIAIQPAPNNGLLFAPFFAVGNGFQTDLDLVNVSSDLVTLKTQFFDGSGSPTGSAVLITIPPGQQVARALKDVFSGVSSTGYIRFEVPPSFVRGPFGPTYPQITGHVRVRSSAGGSTIVPLSGFPLQDSFILGAGTASGEFQGITLVNPASSTVGLSLQAIGSSGAVLSSTTVTLSPGQAVSRLANEFFSGSVPGQAVIRVTSSAPIVATAITGSSSLDTLRSLPVLR